MKAYITLHPLSISDKNKGKCIEVEVNNVEYIILKNKRLTVKEFSERIQDILDKNYGETNNNLIK